MILSHTQPTFDSNGLSIDANPFNYEIEYLDFDRLPSIKNDLLIGAPELMYERPAQLDKPNDWMDTTMDAASLHDIVEMLEIEPFTPRPTASPIHPKTATTKTFPVNKKRALYSTNENQTNPTAVTTPVKKQKLEETKKPNNTVIPQKPQKPKVQQKKLQKLKTEMKPKMQQKPPKTNTTRTPTTSTANSMTSPTQKKSKQTAQQKNKAPRSKWADSDILMLWEGISKHGSEWRVIREFFPGRTYDQIKDKGRRLLQQRRWKSGRTKALSDDASKGARHIARQVLDSVENKKRKL